MYPRFDVCLYIKAFTYKPVKTYVTLSSFIPMKNPTEEEAIINFLSQSNGSNTLDDKVSELISIYSELNRKLPPHFSKLVTAAYVIRIKRKNQILR